MTTGEGRRQVGRGDELQGNSLSWGVKQGRKEEAGGAGDARQAEGTALGCSKTGACRRCIAQLVTDAISSWQQAAWRGWLLHPARAS